jgi:hypothetical protein
LNRVPEQAELVETLKWAWAHSNHWRVTDRRGVQLRSILARATETFAAATRLTGGGYGRQAIMLARPLFEDMVLACWIKWIADPDWVLDRLTEQHRYSAWLWGETADNYPSLSDSIGEAEITSAELDRFKATFGPHGTLTWWAVREIVEVPNPKPGQGRFKTRGRNRTLLTLIEELEHATLPESSELLVVSREAGPPGVLVDRLKYLFDVVNRTNNQILHYTSYGYALAYDHKRKSWRESPSEDLLALARSTLLMTYDKLIFVMCKHGNEEVEKRYLKSTATRAEA